MNIYRKKAIERLEMANWQIETEKTLTLGSTLYFALFNFMQYVLGEPTEEKWKHIGINKQFSKYCKDNNIFDNSTLRNIFKVYERLYIYMIKADYSNKAHTQEEINELKIILGFLREVILKWQN